MSENENQTKSKHRLLFMFVLTFLYMVAELTVGYYGKSTSLIADAFHMLSDVIALIVAFLAIMLSPKKWKKSTFGWARAEVLGALVNAVFLLALCFSILIESIKRFFIPEKLEEPIWVFAVGLGGLIVNLIGLFIFSEGGGHGHSHKKRSGSLIQNHGRLTRMVGIDKIINEDISRGNISPQQISIDEQTIIQPESITIENVTTNPTPQIKISVQRNSIEEETHRDDNSEMNIKGVFLHLLADALGSVIVVISASIVWSTTHIREKEEKKYPHKPENWSFDWRVIDYIDPALSVIAITLIVASTMPLLQEASLILLQTVPDQIKIDELKKKIMDEIPGVIGVHEFHVWQLAGDKIIASIHIICNDINEYVQISHSVKELFHSEGIHSTTVQAEFLNPSNTSFNDHKCLLNCPPKPNSSNLSGSCINNTCCGPPQVK